MLALYFGFQAHVEYETAKRHYAHVDCPGHADYVKVSFRIWFSFSKNVFFIGVMNCLTEAGWLSCGEQI